MAVKLVLSFTIGFLALDSFHSLATTATVRSIVKENSAKMYRSALSLVAFALWSIITNNVLPVLAIPKIAVVGSKFFTEDGDQFYIKGRLSLHPSDPLMRTLNPT